MRKRSGWDRGLKVEASGKGLVGHAGAVLLHRAADRVGLVAALRGGLRASPWMLDRANALVGLVVGLPPSACHRFHLPVSGRIEEAFVVAGKVFLQVGIQDHELVSKDNAETGYEFSHTRGVVTIDTSGSGAGNVGIVAVIPVGMATSDR